MQKLISKKISRWIAIVLAVYILGGAALYYFQEKLLFHPVALPDYYHYHFDVHYKEINLEVNKDKNLSIVQFKVPDSICKGVVLYFHGNRQNINHYSAYAKNFTKHHYEVWMMDYPGYGKSTGARSEEAMYADALLLYRIARARFAPDSIIMYGKSIGTGVAAQLASVRDCKHLLLETPYYSIDALARHYFPIYPSMSMSKYHFPVNEYFEKITAPITIFHGTDDEVIPYKQSKRLLQLKKNTELMTIENGKHNNLNDFPLFHQKLDSILSQ